MKKITVTLLFIFGALFLIVGGIKLTNTNLILLNHVTPTPIPTPTPLPTPTPSPSPTPTPSPLTFAQMNELYGPCVYAPTLMYHHIQGMEQAKADNHAALTVDTPIFRQQMQFLRDHGYTPISAQDIINFFDLGTAVPGKSVVLTFDDGYDDFYSDALPILKEFGYKAILFLPTGLTENPGYITWNAANDAKSNNVLVANHTWSHKNVAGNTTEVENEIMTADKQLADHGLNSPKVFSYPYGLATNHIENFLAEKGYQLAFTTIPGGTLCKQQRYELPRIRIGNTSLSAYGF